MQTILQLSKDDLRAIFQEFSEEKLNLPPQISLPDKISLDEACAILGLQKSSVYRLSMDNKIPFQKYGKRLVFSRKDLLKWIDSRTICTQVASDTLTKAAIKRLK